jgi:hypothetical protein
MLNVIMQSVINAVPLCSVITQSVIMQSIIMQSVIMLSVIMLSVVAPEQPSNLRLYGINNDRKKFYSIDTC